MSRLVNIRWSRLGAAFVFVLAVVAAQFGGVLGQTVSALDIEDAVVWTGAGADDSFSTPENWADEEAPVAGDVIALPGLEGESYVSLVNDLEGVALGGVLLDRSTHSTTYSLDVVVLADGAVITQTDGWNSSLSVYDIIAEGDLEITINNFYHYGNIIAEGDVTLGDYIGWYAGTESSIGGVLILKRGATFSINTSDNSVPLGGLVVENGAQARLAGEVSYPVTFGSGKSTALPAITANISGPPINEDGSYDYGTTVYSSVKFTGPVTLLNNLSVNTSGNDTSGVVEIAGPVTYNGFSIIKRIGSTGKLIVGGKEITQPFVTNEYNGFKPTESLSVAENETAILNGTRQYVTVYKGGLLKGNGTVVSNLYVDAGGFVNPGLSPGTLTVLESLDLYGVYQAEINSKDAYDQLVVGDEYDSEYPAVVLGEEATLEVSLIDDWSIVQGDTFTIIDNRSETPIDGIFQGLPEGARITIGDVVFSISYVGGDGNDVVLTALRSATAPGTPNTGVLQVATANPALLTLVGIVAVASVLFALRRSRQ